MSNVILANHNRSLLCEFLSPVTRQWMDFNDLELRYQAKQLGAMWSKKRKVWVLLYQHAVELGIIHRQRPDLMALVDDVDLYS